MALLLCDQGIGLDIQEQARLWEKHSHARRGVDGLLDPRFETEAGGAGQTGGADHATASSETEAAGGSFPSLGVTSSGQTPPLLCCEWSPDADDSAARSGRLDELRIYFGEDLYDDAEVGGGSVACQ